jgi:tetratricopeptide (TPR) repeat protein
LNRTVIDERIAEYRELLRNDPGAVKAHYGLGVAYFNLGLTEAAIESLERACSLTPENPHIHTQLAVAWRDEARTGDARADDEMRDHIQYALRLDPNSVEALILASEAAQADHDIESAVNFSERAWELEPDRASRLLERMLRLWIGWKRQRDSLVNADFLRVERFSAPLAEELRNGGHITPPTPAAPAATLSAPALTRSAMGYVLKSTLIAFLSGLGLFLIMCVALLLIFDEVESGTSASTALGLTLLGFATLPVILATRAWYKARHKDLPS